MNKEENSVAVFVVGEIGRSPRMQYHAISISKIKKIDKVYLCGYEGCKCCKQILEQEKKKKIEFLFLKESIWNWIPLRIFGLFSFILLSWIKVLLQISYFFFWFFFKLPIGVKFLIVQNPPSIPTLIIVKIICLFFRRNLKLIVDWHNFGYTLIDTKFNVKKKKNFFIKVAKFIEVFFGRLGGNGNGRFFNFCVSEEMKKKLKKWNIEFFFLFILFILFIFFFNFF
jgi:beta-1,4-mannosyltransferase